MSRSPKRRITRFHSFTRYTPDATLAVPFVRSRWLWLVAFLLSPSTAHAIASWLAE